MEMSPKAQARYNAILRQVVLTHGALMDRGSTYYGWIADDWQHKSRCVLTSDAVPQEVTYEEFGSTFDADITKHAIDLSGVNCACGKIVNRTVRWDTTAGAAMEAVFEAMMGEDDK